MKLVELSVKDGKDVYDMLQRIGYDENAFRMMYMGCPMINIHHG